MLSKFLLSHAFDAFLYYIIWQLGTPHVLLKVFGRNASNVSEDMGYTGCNRRNGPDFGRVFLMLYYIDITQNTYIQT